MIKDEIQTCSLLLWDVSLRPKRKVLLNLEKQLAHLFVTDASNIGRIAFQMNELNL